MITSSSGVREGNDVSVTLTLDLMLRWQYTRKARSNIPSPAMQSTEVSMYTSLRDSSAERRYLLVFARCTRQK